MSQRAGTTGRSDSNRPHRSVHRPGPMALVWITVARGVMAIGRRAGPQVETAASRRMEQSAGTLADGRLAAGLDDLRACGSTRADSCFALAEQESANPCQRRSSAVGARPFRPRARG
jgi:hypothetical protein